MPQRRNRIFREKAAAADIAIDGGRSWAGRIGSNPDTITTILRRRRTRLRMLAMAILVNRMPFDMPMSAQFLRYGIPRWKRKYWETLGNGRRPLTITFPRIRKKISERIRIATAAESGFGFLGSLGGGYGGAVLGGLAGSAVPIAGIGTGAVAGSLAGSGLGGYYGRQVGDWVYDHLAR